MLLGVTARAFGAPGTASSRPSPPPSLVEFLPSVGIEPYTLGFKYMFNSFPLPISSIGSGNGMNNVLIPRNMDSIPTESKNSIREGGGEDHEVAVPGSPKA
ncbi:hypothetical protein P8452_43423 [Trifolium repens]|nr:hypothetical protein P8452_43423 [Trifolium repens]